MKIIFDSPLTLTLSHQGRGNYKDVTQGAIRAGVLAAQTFIAQKGSHRRILVASLFGLSSLTFAKLFIILFEK